MPTKRMQKAAEPEYIKVLNKRYKAEQAAITTYIQKAAEKAAMLKKYITNFDETPHGQIVKSLAHLNARLAYNKGLNSIQLTIDYPMNILKFFNCTLELTFTEFFLMNLQNVYISLTRVSAMCNTITPLHKSAKASIPLNLAQTVYTGAVSYQENPTYTSQVCLGSYGTHVLNLTNAGKWHEAIDVIARICITNTKSMISNAFATYVCASDHLTPTDTNCYSCGTLNTTNGIKNQKLLSKNSLNDEDYEKAKNQPNNMTLNYAENVPGKIITHNIATLLDFTQEERERAGITLEEASAPEEQFVAMPLPVEAPEEDEEGEYPEDDPDLDEDEDPDEDENGTQE